MCYTTKPCPKIGKVISILIDYIWCFIWMPVLPSGKALACNLGSLLSNPWHIFSHHSDNDKHISNECAHKHVLGILLASNSKGSTRGLCIYWAIYLEGRSLQPADHLHLPLSGHQHDNSIHVFPHTILSSMHLYHTSKTSLSSRTMKNLTHATLLHHSYNLQERKENIYSC